MPVVPSIGVWWLAIRPKTLSAAIAPVVVGAALAWHDDTFHLWRALAALTCALLIQIGTNLSNDVLDFRRGADHGDRLGPTRVTQAGLLSPRAVATGAAVAYGLATAVGAYLVMVAGLPILVLGVLSIAFGVLYTAGPYPLAYVGLGDVFVLVFFGIAAVAGTYYVQALTVSPAALGLGVAVGAFSVAILNVNNLRDIESDRAAGKRTLAVRIGASRARRYFSLVVAAAFIVPVGLVALQVVGWPLLVVLAVLPQAVRVVREVSSGATGRELNPLLGATARTQVQHAMLLATGLILDAVTRGSPLLPPPA